MSGYALLKKMFEIRNRQIEICQEARDMLVGRFNAAANSADTHLEKANLLLPEITEFSDAANNAGYMSFEHDYWNDALESRRADPDRVAMTLLKESGLFDERRVERIRAQLLKYAQSRNEQIQAAHDIDQCFRRAESLGSEAVEAMGKLDLQWPGAEEAVLSHEELPYLVDSDIENSIEGSLHLEIVDAEAKARELERVLEEE